MGYTLGLREIDATHVALVGGKAANLGELSSAEGIDVPPGFCVTTDAFRRVVADAPSIAALIGRLSRLGAGEPDALRDLSTEIRLAIEALPIPPDLAAAIARALAQGPGHAGWAVRSSATAEDRPASSFAGQHDSYLNVVGPAAILSHVSRCWASLFTERAVAYRARNGFDHTSASMAVLVQRMVEPQAAGVLFTADPVTSNRTVSAVEARFGLGQGLLSGVAAADVYRVRDGEILSEQIAEKHTAMRALRAGGLQEVALSAGRAGQAALSEDQVVRLAQLGRRVEAHLGSPQDIEWCLAGGAFAIVQSRPITTLFPVPDAGDGENHVYVSVGHQQMMTDAMKPLGYSLFGLTALRPMHEAGGRLFVDVARDLASPAGRARIIDGLGRSDPLISDALEAILRRDGFIAASAEEAGDRLPSLAAPDPIGNDPAIVAELLERGRASIAACEREIRTRSGPALLDFIVEDVEELKRFLRDPLTHQVIMAGMSATWWLAEHLEAWLGETSAADALTQSVPGNVTAQMGLALLDVADAIRPHPDVVAFLEDVEEDDFLDDLAAVPGGAGARDAIAAYLDTYGMRCAGEIDITRPRWSEQPSALVPAILANVKSFDPGTAARRFEQGRREAARRERELLERLRALPGGEQKAGEAKLVIERLRTFTGYREYPKYVIVSRYFLYKQALLEEAGRLVRAGMLREPQDIFYLTLGEVRDVSLTRRLDPELLADRARAFDVHRTLTPPRVMTSEGEVVTGSYRRAAAPAEALLGLPVSAGTVEGRARVVLDMADAELEPGDVLVTAYTDPSWSALFPAAAGLVTEVGGLMTHGAVIAREYGLPAVVGVQGATRLIEDGRRIRVHGSEGYVEILPQRARPTRSEPAAGSSEPPLLDCD